MQTRPAQGGVTVEPLQWISSMDAQECVLTMQMESHLSLVDLFACDLDSTQVPAPCSETQFGDAASWQWATALPFNHVLQAVKHATRELATTRLEV